MIISGIFIVAVLIVRKTRFRGTTSWVSDDSIAAECDGLAGENCLDGLQLFTEA